MASAFAVPRSEAGSDLIPVEGVPLMLNVLPLCSPRMGHRAVLRGGVQPSMTDVVMLVADTGHRKKRVLELMGFA